MDQTDHISRDDAVEQTAEIVSAYISHNNVPASELAALIAGVHAALMDLDKPTPIEEAGPEKLTPAQIKKSITPDALISFEDGKPYKTLRRHLNLRGLSPEAYRAKWGLPIDYPITSAGYSAQRSALAHSLGLGQRGALARKAAAGRAAEPATELTADKPKTRGRPRKAANPV